jgi:transcriptional regulator with XRE-family HTH domain
MMTVVDVTSFHQEMDRITKTLGEVVKNMRLESGLSQEQLGSRCGLNRAYIGTIERGEKTMTVETAMKIAYGLKVPLSSIFVRVEEVLPSKERS